MDGSMINDINWGINWGTNWMAADGGVLKAMINGTCLTTSNDQLAHV